MGLLSAESYLQSLNDGREIYYKGKRIPDVVADPDLGIAARHASIDFELAERPDYRDLAVAEEDGQTYSAYYRIPRSGMDLANRSKLIEAGTREGGTLVLLIKEIGSDALFALMRVLRRHDEQPGLEKLERLYRACRDGDLTLAVAQTDVKGDRSKRPSQQADPDLYVHVVSQSDEGIVVRGAKVHISCAPYVDRLIVLPSRSMTEADAPWSVSFTVPVATKGLKLYASDFLGEAGDEFTHPVSSLHRMVEALVVFDDVFVPWEDVFFCDRPDIASDAALAFVEYHRFTAVSYKLPYLDALVGSAFAVAEANGISRASHVREKLTWLVGYAESVRGLIELAALRAREEHGIAFPDVLTTNLAKWHFARDFHAAIAAVQDLAGGLLVTGPSGADWASDDVRPVLEKYLVGAWPAHRRLAVLNLISDLTSRSYGGYQAVLAVHAEGSIEAEKLAMLRAYDPTAALNYALDLAGAQNAG